MTRSSELPSTIDACTAGLIHPGAHERADALCTSIGGFAGAVASVVSGPLGLNIGAFTGAAVATVAGRALEELRPEEPAPIQELDERRREHLGFEYLAADVLRGVASGVAASVAAATEALRSRVVAHFDAEERDLLPGYALVAPDDAAALLREHTSFREALARLDVATDLHLVRVDALEQLFASLRAHASRENAGLYRWAGGR